MQRVHDEFSAHVVSHRVTGQFDREPVDGEVATDQIQHRHRVCHSDMRSRCP